jgi:hypothetical protein
MNPGIDGPIPLFPPLPPARPYPITALGAVLSPPAAAIARRHQVPEAIAAQSVLAVAALAAQVHADVMLPFGQSRPLSLFFATVAASGDRKTTADNEALKPIQEYERFLKQQYEQELPPYNAAVANWESEKRHIEKLPDFEARKAALNKLGSKPDHPLFPFLTAPDPTIEGLAKAWLNAPAGLGIFSAEGGQFISGYGMNKDNRIKTASAFSEIWDGRAFKRIRAEDGVTILSGRRLSFHLMVQPDLSTEFLGDAALNDQGLLSRLLVAAPDSLMGTRLYREFDYTDQIAIDQYSRHILCILKAQWSLAKNRRNELEPLKIPMSHESAQLWKHFHDEVEKNNGPGNRFGPISEFAAKAAEHAARIAGVLTVVNPSASSDNVWVIEPTAMSNAITLVQWYLEEWLRLREAKRIDPRLIRAQRLLDWMQERGPEISFRDIQQYGPNPTRERRAAEEAITTLYERKWLVETSKRPQRFAVHPKI